MMDYHKEWVFLCDNEDDCEYRIFCHIKYIDGVSNLCEFWYVCQDYFSVRMIPDMLYTGKVSHLCEHGCDW